MTASTLTRVEAKAVRLVAQGHVLAADPDTRIFQVASDHRHHTYTVTIGGDGHGECSCPAGQVHRRCSHVLASELWLERERQA